jgi:hypothetical protein
MPRGLTLASRCRISVAIAVWLSIFTVRETAAQPAEPPHRAAAASDAAVPGSELTVYLMTMGPGDAVWEKFGHNAIWIHDAARNTDVAYNWGLFDFAASDFMSRFLKGDMRYWMGGFDQQATVQFYRESNRSVIAQELNLTPSQRTELARFVEWNALPENRFYRYNYYLDNCSTRVRDVINRALGGTLKPQMESGVSGFTYRSETQRLTQTDIPVYTGTMLGLGQPTDHKLTGWQLAFIPGRLSEMLRDAEIPDATGKFVPLIKREDTLFAASRPPELRADELHTVSFFLTGCLLFAIITGLAQLANVRRRWWQPGFLVAASLSSLIVGLAGTGLVALWLMTNHIHSFSNENVLQANPLSLVLAVMILTQFRMRRQGTGNAPFVRPRILRLAWAIVALSVLGLALKILPAFYQQNLQIIALLLPLHLGIALALAGGSIVPARFRRQPASAVP